MAKWINVDQNDGQITHIEDVTFPFGVYRDDYSQMDNHMLPLHWHKYIEYGLVEEGRVEMRIDSELHLLEPGDCVFINANTLHSGVQRQAAERAVIRSVDFTPDLLTAGTRTTVYRRYFDPWYGKAVYGFKIDRDTPSGAVIADLLRKLSDLDKAEYGYELNVLSSVSRLWMETLCYIGERFPEPSVQTETYSHRKNVMRNLLIYIQENYARAVTVEELAEFAHISHSECYRVFRDYTGDTPIGYLNDYRLTQAEHLLRTTSMSMVGICQSCGFSGQSYFGERFKIKYGTSPARFRRNHRGEEKPDNPDA